jgi:hypothetical protein
MQVFFLCKIAARLWYSCPAMEVRGITMAAL